MIRSSPSASCPIEVQVSVATHVGVRDRLGRVASAPAPTRRSARRSRAARATTAGSGSNPAGPATRTCMPAVAPASRYECAMLFARVADVRQGAPGRAAAPLAGR